MNLWWHLKKLLHCLHDSSPLSPDFFVLEFKSDSGSVQWGWLNVRDEDDQILQDEWEILVRSDLEFDNCTLRMLGGKESTSYNIENESEEIGVVSWI